MAKTSPFGEWLHKWRKARRLTQEQLAKLAGCRQSTISEHERGTRQEVGGDFIRPEEDLVERLATALGRPVEEARDLAGYRASLIPPSMREQSLALKEAVNFVEGNPQQAAIVLPHGPQGKPVVVVTDGRLAEALFDAIGKVLSQQAGE